MWAIIETGGKQYRISQGDQLEVEKVNSGEDGEIEINKILAVSKDKEGKDLILGEPFVHGAKVTAKILGTKKGDKVTILKYKPKKRYRVKKGHRQTLTKIEILKIEF